MKVKYCLLAIAMVAVLAIAGCGSSSKESREGTGQLSASASCISCHGNVYAPAFKDGNGNPLAGAPTLAEEYLRSKHAEALGGPSCGGCHNPAGSHPYPGSGGVSTGTAATATCSTASCHPATASYMMKHYSSAAVANEIGAIRTPSAYLTIKVQNGSKCLACHNPHDNSTGMNVNRDWAESGHGKTTGVAWTEDRPWSGSCIRCHTASGFIDFVKIPSATLNPGVSATYTPATTWPAGYKNNELLRCEACHSSYNFSGSVIKPEAFKAPYLYQKNLPAVSTVITFPNAGASNLCIRCHGGRRSGETVRATADVKKASLSGAHYLAAAGTLYAKVGYHFYSSVKKYDNYSTGNGFNHGRIGMEGRISNPVIGSGSDGPCVGCHLGTANGNTRSHTLSALNTHASKGSCYGCHSGENMTLLVEEEKALFDAGMSFFSWQLQQNGYYFNEFAFLKAPYNPAYTEAGLCLDNLPVLNWNTGGATANIYDAGRGTCTTAAPGPVVSDGNVATGYGNLGAAFNFYLLKADKGSHVHNRTYARRLMYDSIQWLQSGTTALAASKVSFVPYSTATPGLTTSVAYVDRNGVRWTGATAIQKWMGSSSGFRK